MNDTKTRALIYCRVSSKRQKTEGHGLDSQEHRCREYAISKGYEIEEIFRDDITGGGDFMLRPAMRELILYVDKRPHKKYIVIFDDLKRFARDTEFHFKLRTALKVRGIKPECLNYNFDDTPEGVFVETIFAAQGQLEKDQNKRQVIQKQSARLEKGYWPFYPPPGYIQKEYPMHGKLLVPVEPQASLIREVFEGFASDRFVTQVDIVKFLRGTNYSKRPIYHGGVHRMLKRVVYAGYVQRDEWEVSRRKGQHEGIISLETFEKVQAKLSGRPRLPVRKSDKLDFVLRGFIVCPFCQHAMTASWSRGRNKMFRYYRCNMPTCVRHNKSVNGNWVDEEFKKFLKNVCPKPATIRLAKEVVADVWRNKIKNLDNQQSQIEKRLTESRKNIDALSDRVIKAVDENIVHIYEEKILAYKKEGEVLQEKLTNMSLASVSFETALELVFEFLKNPVVMWEKEDIDAKRLVLKLVFAEKLVLHPDLGFETAQKSLLIGLFEQISTKSFQDVEKGGFEPPCK
ncbi:MAG: recombinase family protein [Parcubacteria group bacterium]